MSFLCLLTVNFMLYCTYFQYCTARSLILVDSSDELFIMFHLFILNAVSSVAESFYDNNNRNRKDNLHLKNWVACKFTGKESFDEVSTKLGYKFKTVADYVAYIFKLA